MAAVAEDLGAWLEQALLAERQAVQLDLEMRHMALLAEVATRLQHRSPAEKHTALPAWHDSGSSRHEACLKSEPQLVEAFEGCNVPGQVDPEISQILFNQRRPKKMPKQTTAQTLPFVPANKHIDHVHSCPDRLHAFVVSPWFEIFFAMCIIVNSVLMAVEAQYKGLDSGHELNYPGYTRAAEVSWPGAVITLNVFEVLFGCVFVLELLLKIVGLRLDFVKDYWNWIDTVLISLWFVSALSSVEFPLNPMLLRLARLLRLLKLVKLVRSFTSFDPLFLMATAMRGSIGVLVWAVVFILLVQMIFALCLQTMLDGYVRDESMSVSSRVEVYKFYGTFSRALLTMFEITLGNWMPPCRALVENVSEWWMLFSLLHKLIIGFSMVSVITGVFIQETFKVASSDDRIMMRHKERANKTHKKKMQALFEAADADGSGCVGLSEFIKIMGNPAVRTWLSAMELNVSDSEAVFKLLDPGSGQLQFEDLLQGVGQLKGAARSIDLMQLQVYTQNLIQEVQESQSLIRRLLMAHAGNTGGSYTASSL